MKNALFVILFLVFCPGCVGAAGQPPWATELEKEFKKIDKKSKARLGVFVKRLDNGEVLSYNGDDWWYYASSIKLFVLIEVMKQIEEKTISMDQEVVVRTSDYRDGAGQTNWIKDGEKTTVRYLVDQMMGDSDNAATDLLIKLVGVDAVNRDLKTFASGKPIGPITSLLDVRREIYLKLHPLAEKLTNLDFMQLKKAKNSQARVADFVKITGAKKKDLKVPSIDKAYEAYYAQKLNSGSLEAYAAILEKLARGEIITPARSTEILEILKDCRTGKTRVKGGLPKAYNFAHKTGTQHERACDMGIVYPREDKVKWSQGVIMVTCVEDFSKLTEADRMMREAGAALLKAGILLPKKKMANSAAHVQ